MRALLSSDDRVKVIGEVNDWRDYKREDPEADVVITTSASFLLHRNEEDLIASSPYAVLLISDEKFNIDELNRSVQTWGILPYDASGEELSAAIHALSHGLITGTRQLLFSPNVDTAVQSPLTDREEEVLALLSRGMANKQIAASLGISEHTIKFHVSSIYSKLNVTNRTEAVREGLRGGWITL